MKRNLFLFGVMMSVVPMMAQWQMQPTPNDTLQPVRNLGGGKVAFSIYAPNAKQVGFGGDAMPWGKPLEFTKAENGVWTAVISDLKDGVYRYNFTVDGVKVQDPKGALSAETSALANIGDGKQFYDMRTDIPHGAIAQRYYYSKVLNTLRRLHVLSAGWFPAQKEQFEGYHQRLAKAAAGVKKNVRQLVFTQGDPEDIAYQNGLATLKLFDGEGIKYEFYTAPGGHTWYTWRNNLHQLAQRLFK